MKSDWLLLLVPVAIATRYLAPGRALLIFLLAAAAMVPLAKLLSDATEQLAERCGPTLGALLNVTFGNAGELAIGFFALRQGLQVLVKASITGSILVNLLLTLGASMLAGGLRTKTLKFNALAARTQTTMLVLAAISLVLPAGFSTLGGRAGSSGIGDLSLEFSVILLVTYALGLWFSLGTHGRLLAPVRTAEHTAGPQWSLARGMLVLAASAALIGWISEILVGSIEVAALSLGMTELFAGMVIVAIAGNAAEATAAVRAALNNRMDLSVGIAVGSSIQIALFVAPALVILSHFAAPAGPMDLVFTPLEIVALVLTVVIVSHIASDGDSNWLEGVQLVAVYIMLAVMFFYLPVPASSK